MNRYQREFWIGLTYLALLAALAIFAPRFYQGNEARNILVATTPVLVAAVGMTLVILARNIDISIGSQLSICGIVAGLLSKAGFPMPLVAPAVMLVGAALGAVNGLFVAALGLPSIVVTLATMVIFRNALQWCREGAFVNNLGPDFQWFGLGQAAGQWVVVSIAGITWMAFALGLRFLAGGRAIYATGSDLEAAWLVGIRSRRVVFFVFILMGALTGLAALLSAVQLPNVDPTAGAGLELEVIAAVVVGGVAISGGQGNLLGVLLGVVLLATIRPALIFFHTEPYWEKALQGAIILIAIASDALNFRWRKHGIALAAQ
jgi:rhamnose transport system permease protein